MKLNKEQIALLSETKEEDYKTVFPGYTRAFLRKQKELIPKVEESVENDRELIKTKSALTGTSTKYKQALSQIELLEKEKNAILSLSKSSESCIITPNGKHGESQAVPVICWSDWHLEENIKKSNTNGLNEFNLLIAQQRVHNLFKNTLSLLNIFKRDVSIKDMVLFLGGDFINGNIHEEFSEGNNLPPMEAILLAQSYLKSGIDFLLKHTSTNIKVVCHSGNHARITKESRISTEAGNSLEYFMYHTLSTMYKDDKRVEFIIPSGYHSYVTVFGKVLRFHHGHQMRYGGGVGGIYIPVNKSISQWNKGIKADYDVFGHFHQLRDGGNFICNGSLVGFNDYAISIKADYEEPKQVLFLIDSKRGRTISAPIFVDRN